MKTDNISVKTTLKTVALSALASSILFSYSAALGEGHAATHEPAAHAKDDHAPAAEPKPAEAKQADDKTAEPKVDAKPDAKPDAKVEEKESGPTADEVVETLRDGNRRFTSGDSVHPRGDQDRRSETYTGGQHPMVSILSCADSRVPPELIFDAGIGDLFVIRVAGNVMDTDEIATIEYGAGHLHTPLIVVMGHTKCGAVAAVVDGAPLHGNLAELTENIHAPAEKVKLENPMLKGQSLNNKVIRANVFQSMQDLLEQSEEVRDLVEKKKVKIVGAVYDINSGFIDWLGEHPRQEEIISLPFKEKKHGEELMSSSDDEHKAKPADTKAAKGKTPAKKDEHTSTANEAHSSADKKTDAKATQVSMFKQYGPLGAFVIGSLALSGVFLHLVRK